MRNKILGDNSDKKSIFYRIESALKINGITDGIPFHYLPQVLFIFFLLLLYIGNSHMAEKTVRKINNLEEEVEDLRADYTTMKAEFMLSGKQSEVAQKVASKGIKESLTPPHKIIIKD